MSSPSVKGVELGLIVIGVVDVVARDVEGAVVVEDSGDVVECASDAKAPVPFVAGDWEGGDVAEGASVAGDGDNLEISFVIFWTDTELWF